MTDRRTAARNALCWRPAKERMNEPPPASSIDDTMWRFDCISPADLCDALARAVVISSRDVYCVFVVGRPAPTTAHSVTNDVISEGEEGRWGRVTPHHHPELWDWAPEDDRKANRRTHIQTRLQISIFYRRRHSGWFELLFIVSCRRPGGAIVDAFRVTNETSPIRLCGRPYTPAWLRWQPWAGCIYACTYESGAA